MNVHTTATDILLGLREIMDEADGPVLPSVASPVGNIEGDEHMARLYLDYGPGEKFVLILMRVP